MKNIIFTLTVLCFIFIGNFVSVVAQAQVSGSIKLNPKNPEPKSVVTLTLTSYSFNVNTAMISWKSQGKILLQGQGEKSLEVKTGEVGESYLITVIAQTADGSSLEQSITISPSSVTLLYEAPKSYVPLFYEGRSLPSDGALVRVTALPSISDEGTPVPSSKLSYTWYLDDDPVRISSGLGKQSAYFQLDYLQNKNTIKVIVRSPYGNTGEKSIVIYPHAVMPLLYSYNALMGSDFTTLLQKRFETVKDFTLSLEPFYVSDDARKPASFVWYLDGLPATPLGGRILSMHPKEDSYGSKMLSIDVFGTDRRVQKASTKMEILFDTRK